MAGENQSRRFRMLLRLNPTEWVWRILGPAQRTLSQFSEMGGS